MDQPIQIKRNALDVIETVVSLCSLVGVAAYLILAWRTIPDQVPTHFNAAGEIDSLGGKNSLLLLPIVSWLLYGLIGSTVDAQGILHEPFFLILG